MITSNQTQILAVLAEHPDREFYLAEQKKECMKVVFIHRILHPAT